MAIGYINSMVDRLPQVATDNHVTRFFNITDNKALAALVTLVNAAALTTISVMVICALISVFLKVLGVAVVSGLVTLGLCACGKASQAAKKHLPFNS